MIEYKQSVAAKVPVRVFDSGGSPVNGITFSSVSATVMKSDGTTTTVTVTISDWTEITTGAFATTGYYTLLLPSSALNTAGLLVYAVYTGATNQEHIGAIKVVANEEIDTYSRVGAPAGASISADIATRASQTSVNSIPTNPLLTTDTRLNNLDATISTRATQTSVNDIQTDVNTLSTDVGTLSTDLAAVATDVERIKLLKEGRWKIYDSGPDINRLVLYAADGVTVLQKWNLKDKTGAASSTEVYERVPVLAIP